MPTVTRDYLANFGAARGNLSTVGCTINGSRATSGVSELVAGTGIYKAAITHDVTFQGEIIFDTGQSPAKYLAITVNPVFLGSVDATQSGSLISPSSSLGTLGFTPYACDEQIAIRAAGDYLALCPSWQTLATGSDGFFTAGGPWLLQSSGSDFNGLGVQASNIVALVGPKANYQGKGQLFAVSSVSTNAVLLRNVGLAAGVGQPAGPIAGLTGVSFLVPTFAPQIDQACLDLNRVYGLDPNVALSAPGFVYDPSQDLAQLAVLWVLKNQYAQESRTDRGDFSAKAKMYSAMFDSLVSRVTVRFGQLGKAESNRSIWSTQVRR